MATSAEPARLPHLQNERRAAIRKPLPAHSLIELQPGRGGSARDVSEAGVSLFGSTDLNVGSDTFVRFILPGSNAQIEACGVVAWTDDSATGIRFTEISTKSIATLQNWIETSTPTDDQPEVMRTDAVLAAKVACLREIADLQAQISSEDLDKDAALALIVRRLAELTRASGAAIALRDGQHVICRASYGNAPDVGVQLSQSSLSGECLRTANVVLLHDSETDPRVDAEICRQLNFRSLLIVPVLSDGKPAGIAEVLSPNPGNFEGGDILVVTFIADLIAGAAVPVEQNEAAIERRTSFEPLTEPDQPRPQIALEVPIPATPISTPAPSHRAAEPASIAASEVVTPPPPKPVAGHSVVSSPAVPMPMRAPAPMPAPELPERISAEDDRQKRLLILVLVALLLIAIAGFALFRFRTTAPSPKPTQATTSAVTPAAMTTTAAQPVPAPTVDSVKPEQKKPSATPAHAAKSSSGSHNGQDTQEIAVREGSPSTTTITSDAPPEAPSVAQLSTRSSATLAAEIVSTNTPTPQLNPIQSSGVVEGKLIKKVLPQYPEMARRAGVGGDVILSATIGTDGRLKNIKVLSGSPLLREEAIIAARQWRYTPYLLGGMPVETDTRITISFKR